MRSLNRAEIIGHLGADPEVRFMPNGDAVANLSVATDESYTKDGQVVAATQWHKIAIFGRLAEISGQYLKKGSKVYFAGRMQTRKWQDKYGTERYTTEIRATELLMLDGKQEAAQEAAQDRQLPAQPQQQKPAPNGVREGFVRGGSQPAKVASQPEPDFDDDIPF
jgi:single-strand DNA-binding protein